MVANSPSGMYKCSICGNIISHHQGNEFDPCTHCDNSAWEIIQKDPDYIKEQQETSRIHQHS